jgi:hypothetical protein
MRPIDADAFMKQLEKKKCREINRKFLDGFNDCMMRVRSMVHSAPTLTLPSEWVSAEDDPPKLTGKYICCVEDIHGHMWSISADYLFEMKTWVGEFGEIKNKVVFWMPLPNPPDV